MIGFETFQYLEAATSTWAWFIHRLVSLRGHHPLRAMNYHLARASQAMVFPTAALFRQALYVQDFNAFNYQSDGRSINTNLYRVNVLGPCMYVHICIHLLDHTHHSICAPLVMLAATMKLLNLPKDCTKWMSSHASLPKGPIFEI